MTAFQKKDLRHMWLVMLNGNRLPVYQFGNRRPKWETGNWKIFGNFLREVRGWNSPFLRLTDDRKRCFKQKRDLILRWRCTTMLVLTVTTLYRDPRGKMGP